MEIFAVRTIENFSEFVNESDFAAVANECDGRALGNINANAIWQDALKAGGLYPGNFFHVAAARIERNAQDAAAAVFVKRREHCFTRDDVIAGHFHLLGLQQKDFGRVEEKISHNVSRDA